MPFVDDGISSPVANVVTRTDATPYYGGAARLVDSLALTPDAFRDGGTLPTADPHKPGALWMNNGVLTTSAG